MVFDLRKAIVALLVAVIVGLILMAFLGPAISTLKAPIADVIGGGLTNYGWTIGVLAGLWYYFH